MHPTPPRPPGFVHVDLDGLWTLAACYGFPEGDLFEQDHAFGPPLERLLECLRVHRIRATFFICGRDLTLPFKADRVIELAREGHELAAHAWSHPLDLENLPDPTLTDEIERPRRELARLVGSPPIGFRAPGYAAGPRILSALARAGFRYDGSCLPTRFGWLLARAAGHLRRQVRRYAPETPLPNPAGQYRGAIHPAPVWIRPAPEAPPILRLPVAVSPILRLPIHASLGMLMGPRPVASAIRRLAATHPDRPVTYLLHALDLAAPEELAGRVPAPLLNNRGFRLALAARRDFIDQVLTSLRRHTELMLTRDWLQRIQPSEVIK